MRPILAPARGCDRPGSPGRSPRARILLSGRGAGRRRVDGDERLQQRLQQGRWCAESPFLLADTLPRVSPQACRGFPLRPFYGAPVGKPLSIAIGCGSARSGCPHGSAVAGGALTRGLQHVRRRRFRISRPGVGLLGLARDLGANVVPARVAEVVWGDHGRPEVHLGHERRGYELLVGATGVKTGGWCRRPIPQVEPEVSQQAGSGLRGRTAAGRCSSPSEGLARSRGPPRAGRDEWSAPLVARERDRHVPPSLHHHASSCRGL
jgi:hypothetical protein